MTDRFSLTVLVGLLSACGQATTAPVAADSSATAEVAAPDTASASADAAKSADIASTDSTTDLAVAKDVATVDAKPDAPKPIACADRAGGYLVDGKCSNGGASIPFACMLAKGCELTWQTDFRNWTGPLVGNDYTLVNAAKTDKIVGKFESATGGSYTYEGPGLTCNATMERFESSFATDVCCNVVAQGCADAGSACVPIQESAGPANIVTTGCVPLGDAPTTVDAPCNAAPGALTCKAGLMCIKDAAKGDGGHCKKLCVAAGDCPAGQACTIASTAPKGGVCFPSCSPFAAVGADGACAVGQACMPLAVSDAAAERVMGARCVPTAGGKAGDACGAGANCENGAVCVAKLCAPLCDDAHPCKSGQCTGFGPPNGPDVGKGFGYCK